MGCVRTLDTEASKGTVLPLLKQFDRDNPRRRNANWGKQSRHELGKGICAGILAEYVRADEYMALDSLRLQVHLPSAIVRTSHRNVALYTHILVEDILLSVR